jgi:preprotein translocase subunit SecF
MRELISSSIKIDFMGKRHICAFFSMLAVAWAIWVFVSTGDSKFGTDFLGGSEFLVTFNGDFDSEKIRGGLATQGISDARVQAFQGTKNEYSIRLGEVSDPTAIRAKIDSALKGAFGDAAQIQKTDFVGPTVGHELQRSALIAVALGLIGMLIYIAIRFEFAVGLGSIVALFHDVIIATGIYIASGHLIGMATLAGALTIVGYSVNDTVVVFDRVREERAQKKSHDIAAVVNEALNFTLSRTVITHVLTLISALALYVIGTGDIKDLSLYLVAGIVLGSYSTIFIVAPIVVAWEKFKGREGVVTVSQAQAKRA